MVFGLVTRFTDHLQDATTNNYNIIAISTLHSSLLHPLVSSVYYSLHYRIPDNGF
jgi:hypothetical protein